MPTRIGGGADAVPQEQAHVPQGRAVDPQGRAVGGRGGLLRAPLVTAAAALGGTVAVVVADPTRPGGPVLCPLLAVTGLACPFCGGLRTVHALSGADLAAAWAANPMLAVALPLTVLAWAYWSVRAARGRRLASPPAGLLPTLLVVVVAFGVARNLPPLQPFLAGWLA